MGKYLLQSLIETIEQQPWMLLGNEYSYIFEQALRTVQKSKKVKCKSIANVPYNKSCKTTVRNGTKHKKPPKMRLIIFYKFQPCFQEQVCLNFYDLYVDTRPYWPFDLF